MKSLAIGVGLAILAAAAVVSADPLYRMYISGDHFYTMSTQEVASAAAGGYKLEGNVGQCSLAQVANTIPLYRLYNGTIVDHFYTTNAQERDLVIAGGGYVSEGVTCWVHDKQTDGTCPLYRMYSGGATDHFYTLSWKEVLSAAGGGYAYEGVAAYMGFEGACPQ